MGDIMRREVENLARLREQIKQMGGEEAVKKHHGRGKLTARERRSMGVVNETKVSRIREVALRERIPMIWLNDSGGARVSGGGFSGERVALFADTGYLFKEESLMSGVVPQIAAMMGPGYAGTAYIPGLSDFVPMVKGTSFMGLGGPALKKSVIGEKLTEDEL